MNENNVIFYKDLKCCKDANLLPKSTVLEGFDLDLNRETRTISSNLGCSECGKILWQHTWHIPYSKAVSTWMEELRLSQGALSLERQ